MQRGLERRKAEVVTYIGVDEKGLSQRPQLSDVGQRYTGGLELMREIGVEFFARETFQMILHGNALAQRFVHLQRECAAKQRLSDQQQGQITARIHVEVEQQRKLFERRMAG